MVIDELPGAIGAPCHDAAEVGKIQVSQSRASSAPG
jgi:hypothetical protein